LQVHRHEGDRAEQREADDKADRAGDREDPVGEQAERQDRLVGDVLDGDEPGERRQRPGSEAQRGRRGPGDSVSAEAGEEDQCRQRRGEERGAGDQLLPTASNFRTGARRALC